MGRIVTPTANLRSIYIKSASKTREFSAIVSILSNSDNFLDMVNISGYYSSTWKAVMVILCIVKITDYVTLTFRHSEELRCFLIW